MLRALVVTVTYEKEGKILTYDDAKAVADYITLDVDHSGLAAAIRKFLL